MKLLKENHLSWPVIGKAFPVLLIWMLAGAGAAYWVLKWPDHASVVNVNMDQSVAQRRIQGLEVQRVLGAIASEDLKTSDLSRFKLVGVIASSAGQGSALIAVDGQAPKPYRVGQAVGEGLILQSLGPKRAQLAASLNGPVLREISLQQSAKL